MSFMTTRRIFACHLGVLCLLLLAPCGLDAQGQRDRVTMDFGDIELRKAIRFIIRDRPVNLVTGERLDEVVTIKLVDVPWRQALRSLLETHGYTSMEEEGIVRVIRMTTTPEEAKERRIPFVVELEHADAREARTLLEGLLSEEGRIMILEGNGERNRTLSIIDTPAVIDVVKKLITEIDVPPREATTRITRRRNDTIDIKLRDFPLADLDVLLQKELGLNVFILGELSGTTDVDLRGVSWEDALTLILAEHGFTHRVDGDVVLIDEFEAFAARRITRHFRLRFVDAHDIRPYLEELLEEGDRLSLYAPSPRRAFEFGTKVTEQRALRRDEDSGAPRARDLSLTARPDTVDAVAERIAEMDREPQQIKIEVKVVQVRRENGRQAGVDWNAVVTAVGGNRPTTLPWGPEDGRYFPGTFPEPDGEFVFGSLRADQLTAVLRLMESEGEAEIISEPSITTLDNSEASILVGQKFPVTTETIDPQTAVRTVTLEYYEDIGIQLLVVPSIAEDDRIHMTIHPAVSSFSELVDDRFPIIDTREADTQLLIRSGETAMIGGLLEQDTDHRIRGIPILRHIPILGSLLFEYTDRSEGKTELVIFVTPTIVLSAEERARDLRVDASRIEALVKLRDGLAPELGR